jgi:glycine betaine transporter
MDLPTNKNRLGAVFWVSSIAIALFVLWGAVYPERMAKQASYLFDYTSLRFGWFYLLSTGFFILFAFYLAFSRFGSIKLGAWDSKPEYAFLSWVGMIMSAGFGVALVFWGVAEPMKHYLEPPPGVVPETNEAAQTALRYSFFHWGIHQWAIFCVVGLSLGYFQFREQSAGLISSTLFPLLGPRGDRYLGTPINILAVIATATGVATTLGMGILQINGGMHHVLGWPDTLTSQLTITVVLCFLYVTSSITGLQRGIKLLSQFNIGLTVLLILIVWLLGPGLFILNAFTSTLGEYMHHFIPMSFDLAPFSDSTWVRDWTVFYWAWAIAWSPLVGSFIARISKGRTIREFVLVVMLAPAFIAMLWISVFGGTALHLQIEDSLPIGQAVQDNITSALFVTLESLSGQSFVSIAAILLILTFLITSADSATVVLGIMTTNGNLNPKTSVKIVWGVLQAAVAAVLLISSGLEGLQTASLVAAVPFCFVLVAMCISLVKALHQDQEMEKEDLSLTEKSDSDRKAV